MISIKLTSVLVNDQSRALQFYTEVLGFVKKTDVPAGGARWLTVVSPADSDGTEILLEPLGFPPAVTYQKALYDAGIPLTAFVVDDIQAEYKRLKEAGVRFTGEPTNMGGAIAVSFDDTCGNLIQLYQVG